MTCRGFHADSLSVRFCGFNHHDENDDNVFTKNRTRTSTYFPLVQFAILVAYSTPRLVNDRGSDSMDTNYA